MYKVLAFYPRGQSTREIQGVLEDLYGTDVSPTLISNVTEGVLDDLKAWQARPLSAVYPIPYFDPLVVKSREDGSVKNRSVYLALGVKLAGEKELLGMWMAENEGTKFWLKVFTELKNRGVEECFVACVDGLKGLPEAIEAVFPEARVQPCIARSWRADWDRLTVFFDFAPEIRRVVYTTNAIESLNYSMRKVLKNRGAFPNDPSIQYDECGWNSYPFILF